MPPRVYGRARLVESVSIMGEMDANLSFPA